MTLGYTCQALLETCSSRRRETASLSSSMAVSKSRPLWTLNSQIGPPSRRTWAPTDSNRTTRIRAPDPQPRQLTTLTLPSLRLPLRTNARAKPQSTRSTLYPPAPASRPTISAWPPRQLSSNSSTSSQASSSCRPLRPACRRIWRTSCSEVAQEGLQSPIITRLSRTQLTASRAGTMNRDRR